MGNKEKDLDHKDSFAVKKEAIIKASAGLFHRKGFHGTSIGDIANEVGLPKGGIYHYIESKQDLLFEIITRGIRQVLPILREIKNTDRDPGEKLLEAVRANVKLLTAHKEYVSVFLQERNSLQPDYYNQYIKDRDEVEWIFRDIIQEGIDKKVFRRTNAKIATFAILGMCNWATQWYNADDEASADEIADIFAEAAGRILK